MSIRDFFRFQGRINKSRLDSKKVISRGQRINPKRQKKKRFCREHNITGKQYRRYQKKRRRNEQKAELYLSRIEN